MNYQLPQGILTALLTPFHRGKIDIPSLHQLLEFQKQSAVEGVVIAGTSGEISTLAPAEYAELLRKSRQIWGKDRLLIAGTGSNNTAEAIERTQLAESLGADAALIVTPYYNNPNQAGLFAHYGAIAESTALPIILYSIKSRCSIELEIETVIALHEKFPQICALKECSGAIQRVAKLHRVLGKSFRIYSGDDSLSLPMISLGAAGVVSAYANAFPRKTQRLISSAIGGDFATALRCHLQLLPLWEALSGDVNPVPIKYAAKKLQLIADEKVRLPLIPLTDEKKRRIDAAIDGLEKEN